MEGAAGKMQETVTFYRRRVLALQQRGMLGGSANGSKAAAAQLHEDLQEDLPEEQLPTKESFSFTPAATPRSTSLGQGS